MFVTVRQSILVDLAEIAPGPELAHLLSGIKLSLLSGYDCVEVLKAQYRRGPRRAGIDPRAADSQFWLAYDLLTRLPAVHAAMEAGVLDEPRGRVFSDWTTELRPEAARAVCAELLPRAPGLTTGQLIEQIKRPTGTSTHRGQAPADGQPRNRSHHERLRPERRRDPTAFIQAIRRGHYALGGQGNSNPTGHGCLRRARHGDLTNLD